jgi:hypothetical protein
MTSRNDMIRTNSAAVISDAGFGLGRTWEFARRTSKFGVEPRTFGDYEDVTALDTLGRGNEEYDETKNINKLVDVINIRISEFAISPALKMGDIFRCSDGTIWAISSINPYRVGTIHFTATRDTGLNATMNKGAAV